jgi:hypothetical protein
MSNQAFLRQPSDRNRYLSVWADEMMKLIDLADKRRYVAKERRRNQVEPDKSHWEKLQTGDDYQRSDF